jgi:L-threonylcarbamoyladenylate synthase
VSAAIRLVVDVEDPREEIVARAASVLRSGGIVALPTETFYGLAVDPRDQLALDRLWERKGRDKDKAFPLISSSRSAVEDIAELGREARLLGEHFWPGPLTLVLRARAGWAAMSADGSVAVRVSSVRLARRLSEALGAPITATSANRSGSRPARTASEVEEQLGAAVDLVLDGGSAPGGLPSTIVDVREGAPRLVREGVVPYEEILAVLRRKSKS